LTLRFAGERVVVVGAGVAGAAAARILSAEGAIVRVTEMLPADRVPEVARLIGAGLDVRAGGHEPGHLDDATLVVTGPGVAPEAEVLQWARDRGLPVWGELELGARLTDVPYLGVTGTNGKTTTTGMITACLQAAGIDAVACGNIGHPFPTAAREGHQVLVVECSSFQLAVQDSFRPRVSVLLNLAPDHLDWHGSYGDYASSKSRIFALQRGEDAHIGNRDDADAFSVSADATCRTYWFTLDAPRDGQVGYEGSELVSMMDGVERLGPVESSRAGYRANAAAAAAAAILFGAPPDAVRKGLEGFVPEPHRGDLVAEVGGVRFVDDSKATNVHAAVAALAGVDDAVLIAGGRAKGVDLSPIADHAARLRGVVAIGESAQDLVRFFEGRVPIRTADSIEEAVTLAHALAAPGSTVLLAPACASWDQFRDYRERGDRFAAAARALEALRAHG
jgi:UDP-N-acetylmuramoylalanine--D-glutamate ligase